MDGVSLDLHSEQQSFQSKTQHSNAAFSKKHGGDSRGFGDGGSTMAGTQGSGNNNMMQMMMAMNMMNGGGQGGRPSKGDRKEKQEETLHMLEVQNQAIEQALKEAKRKQYVDDEDAKQKKLVKKLEVLEDALLEQTRQEEHRFKNQNKKKVNHVDLLKFQQYYQQHLISMFQNIQAQQQPPKPPSIYVPIPIRVPPKKGSKKVQQDEQLQKDALEKMQRQMRDNMNNNNRLQRDLLDQHHRTQNDANRKLQEKVNELKRAFETKSKENTKADFFNPNGHGDPANLPPQVPIIRIYKRRKEP